MNKYSWIWSLAFLAIVVAGCDEEEVFIPFSDAGPAPVDSLVHRVLVEEISGVNCPNCPDGNKALSSLQENVYGKDRIIIVTMHTSLAGAFSNLLPGSRYDFRTPEIDNLVGSIGELSAVPSASFDRVIDDGSTSPFETRSKWNTLIATRVNASTAVDLEVENTFNANNRQLDIGVTIKPQSELQGEHRLTVYITQDSIIDAQNDEGVYINDYLHRHILRDVVSATNGDVIMEPLEGGNTIQKTYRLNLPAEWNEKHCEVVAFIHQGSGFTDKIVLQAADAHVVD